jgi:1,4-alpha-glucan branching enzyme
VSLGFVLTLHSHLPWVLHHGRWPHGSDWLCEAALDTYLPLVAALRRLEAAGTSAPITLGVTPILAAQLAHASFREELEAYFTHRLQTLHEAPASLRETGDQALLPVVPWWQQHIQELKRLWQAIDGDLIGEFRRHAQAGRLELISSAATHGFLPLLARDESIRLQLLVGRAEHLRHFGELPHGCWVPECAYRPAGPWHPLPAAPAAPMRRGIEDHLRYAGFRWFFVDAHLAEAGEASDIYGGTSTGVRRGGPRSPYRAYQLGTPARGRPLHVLVRDPRSTTQVWSRYGGYPGDGRYLEFHKIRYPGGLKLWSVTDTTADLSEKRPYDPAAARVAATAHAEHFATLLAEVEATAQRGDRAIVAPFDTELFGHWWFEGVDFVEDLFGTLARGSAVQPMSAATMLRDAPPDTTIRLGAGSWGANGDFSMWLNPETAWTWERLWPLEQRFWEAVPIALDQPVLLPVLEQAARELLLAQSSDWQFIISTGAAGDYATKRFNEHCEALERLLPVLEDPMLESSGARALAASLERIDGPFPDLIGAIAAASDVTAP